MEMAWAASRSPDDALPRVNRAFRFANAAIDAFVGVNDKHVLALIEAVHRTHLDTVHVLAANAALIDDVGQSSLLPECITPGTRPLFSVPILSYSGVSVRVCGG